MEKMSIGQICMQKTRKIFYMYIVKKEEEM